MFVTAILLLCVTLPAAAQKETVQVEDFDKVSMGRSGTVYLRQGNETRVEIIASEEVKEDLQIEVRNGELQIRNKRNNWRGSSGKLEVFVITPEINAMSVSGSGKIIAENKINTKELRIAVSGSGKVISPIEAEKTTIAISGSGDAELSGQVGMLNAAISGSGGVSGEDLRVEKCEITISGSGNCKIHVKESIDARISGSGSVKYTGDPAHVNSKTSGSGSIKKVG